MIRIAKFMTVYRLLFSAKGRLRRSAFWLTAALSAAFVVVSLPTIESLFGRWGTVIFYLPFYWLAVCILIKRCHDVGHRAWWLLIIPVPIVGIVWAFFVLGLKRGNLGTNQYGADPRPAPPEYATVEAMQ